MGPFASLGPLSLAGLVVLAYVGQDAAHWISGESTFDSTYKKKDDWLSQLSEHTYYLLPLVLDSTLHMQESFFSWMLPHNYVIKTKLESKENGELITTMREWVLEQDPPHDQTTHWYSEELPDGPNQAFKEIANCDEIKQAFHKRFPEATYAMDTIPDMNEVYVSCTQGNKMNSDTVFYMPHVDGPYGIFPFCFVYRCMLGVSPNQLIKTSFTLNKKGWTVSTGDLLGFDYHREIHYIHHNKDTKNEGHRIVLKLHYVVYPKCLKAFGFLLSRLSTRYNQAARELFLRTIKPKNLFWKFMAKQVLIGTELTLRIQKHLGMNNVAMVVIFGTVAALFGNYSLFLYATSYVHYCIYISTYYHRAGGLEAISYGEFQRNCVFWKTLALVQAFSLYLLHFELDVISLVMIVAGFSLSSAATAALGWDRTYFGWELGYLPGKFITTWPYGPNGVPHPMIVGGVLGWLGIFKMAALRANYPYLALGHVALYLVHMAQEHMAIYANGLIQKEVHTDNPQKVKSK
jgi:hypothetical protein